MMDIQEAHRILGVRFGATKKEIDNAYFSRIKHLRSKDYEDEPEYAAQRLCLVQEARQRITVSGHQREGYGGRNGDYDNRRGVSMQRREFSNESETPRGCVSPQYAGEQTDFAEENMSDSFALQMSPMLSNYAKLNMMCPPTYIKPVSTIANYALPTTATASISLKPNMMATKLPINGLGFGQGRQMSPNAGLADMSAGVASVTDLEPKKHIEDCELGDETNSDRSIAEQTAAGRMRSMERAGAGEMPDNKPRTGRGAALQEEGMRSGVRSNNGAFYGNGKPLDLRKPLGGGMRQQNVMGKSGAGIKHLSQYDGDVIRRRTNSQKSELVKDIESIFSGRMDLSGKTMREIAANDKAKTLGIIGFIIFILPIALTILGGIGSMLDGADVYEGGRGYEYEETTPYDEEINEFVNTLDDDQIKTFDTILAFIWEDKKDFYEQLDDTQKDLYYDRINWECEENDETLERLNELCHAVEIDSVEEFVYIFTLGKSEDLDYTFLDNLHMFAKMLHCPGFYEAGGCINLYRDTRILNINDYIDFLTDVATEKRAMIYPDGE